MKRIKAGAVRGPQARRRLAVRIKPRVTAPRTLQLKVTTLTPEVRNVHLEIRPGSKLGDAPFYPVRIEDKP